MGYYMPMLVLLNLIKIRALLKLNQSIRTKPQINTN